MGTENTRMSRISSVICRRTRQLSQIARGVTSLTHPRAARHALQKLPGRLPQLTPFAAARGLCSSGGVVKPFNLADIGEGIAEVEVLQWYVNEGDEVSMFDKICEVQSDKATVDISSKYDGVITTIHYEVGDMAAVGSPLIDIRLAEGEDDEEDSAPAQSSTPAAAAAAAPAAAAPVPSGKHKALAVPAVRRIAMENGIDITTVPGSGKDGRVMKQDILAFLAGDLAPVAAEAPAAAAPSTSAAAPVVSRPAAVHVAGGTETVPLRGFARAMAKSMQSSLQIPHLMYADEVCADAMIACRGRFKKHAEARGVKLTYMPLMIKAASLAISDYPLVNSVINSDLTEVTIHHSHNVGFAVATPSGLVVPNIKDCQTKSIWDIAHEMNELIEAARNNALDASTMSGTTFTLSNIGTIGGTYTSPIINPPQVAIGAIGKLQKLPRYDEDGAVVPQTIFNISWSGDHRVIDGSTIALFGNQWKAYVEDPELMMLSMR